MLDGDALTFSVVSPPSHGAVVIVNATTGAYIYMPAANFNGSDSFTFRAADASLSSNIATVTIVVAPAGPPAPATFHAIGDLPGGPIVSVVRDATRVGGVIYAVGASAANTQVLCVGPNNPAGCVPQFNPDTAVLWTWNGDRSGADAAAQPGDARHAAGEPAVGRGDHPRRRRTSRVRRAATRPTLRRRCRCASRATAW